MLIAVTAHAVRAVIEALETELRPLTAEHFMAHVVHPEIAVRLIMEDRSITHAAAVEILQKSGSWGYLVHPETEDGDF